MTFDEAQRLAVYVETQCWWLDVRSFTHPLTGKGQVLVSLYWPKNVTQLITTYSRRAADTAVDRLIEASELYWDTA